jgi:hypothetical protein
MSEFRVMSESPTGLSSDSAWPGPRRRSERIVGSARDIDRLTVTAPGPGHSGSPGS